LVPAARSSRIIERGHEIVAIVVEVAGIRSVSPVRAFCPVGSYVVADKTCE
jgi:hypothetical protein